MIKDFYIGKGLEKMLEESRFYPSGKKNKGKEAMSGKEIASTLVRGGVGAAGIAAMAVGAEMVEKGQYGKGLVVSAAGLSAAYLATLNKEKLKSVRGKLKLHAKTAKSFARDTGGNIKNLFSKIDKKMASWKENKPRVVSSGLNRNSKGGR